MKEFKLLLNVNEVNTILKALGNMPYNQVNDIVSKIHTQAQEQLTNAVINETSATAEKDLTHK
jgi:phosphoribosylformylglycinamidine (FGAM) synthase PurS component